MDKKAEAEEGEVCEVCGKPATMGIPQDEGDNTIHLCDDCYVERGIEGEEIVELDEEDTAEREEVEKESQRAIKEGERVSEEARRDGLGELSE